MKLIKTLFLLVLSFFAAVVNANQIKIAVASNFTQTMKFIVDEFEKETNTKVKASYASSGKLYAQIHHGAPYHLFFSADQNKPLKLIQSGLADPDSRYTYALGQLVLWSNKTDLQTQVQNLLKDGKYNKLALANAKLAPYGLAAQQVLNNLGLVPSSRTKWVQGENISQTYQFIATGNADLGFIANSQLQLSDSSKPKSIWQVPVELYSPVKQDMVLLLTAKRNPAALRFMQFIHSAKVKTIIESNGYITAIN